MAYSPDGRMIAIGHVDGLVKLWDLIASQERLSIQKHRGWVNDIAFAPDGSSLATVMNGDLRVRVWDIATGRERYALGIDDQVAWDAASSWGTLVLNQA